MRKIKCTLGTIDKAIKEIKEYREWLTRKTKELNKELAHIGTEEAAHRFGTAMYDGNNDVVVEAEQKDNGWVIRASGQAVLFLEFASGVYHNPGGDPYPGGRPPGISAIGTYGKGYGKRQLWAYTDDSGNTVLTRGNPPALGMYFAMEEMRNKLIEVAREVFSH